MPFFEAFALAAPELAPAAAETFAFAPEALYGASEFGTGAAFDALAGSSALGATNAGILGALGAGGPGAMAPIAEGVTSGGLGAGAADINAAQIAQQQAQATQVANSGMQQAAVDSASKIPMVEAPVAPPTSPVGLEQVPDPLSEAAKRTIEGAKTYGPATNEEFASSQLQAAKDAEAAKYEETIQNLSNSGIKQVSAADTMPQIPYDAARPMASYPGSYPEAQSLYPQDVASQVQNAPSAMNNASNATSRFTDAMQGPGTNSSPFGSPSAMNEASGTSRFTDAMQGPGTNSASAPVQSAMNEVAGGQPAPYEWAGNNANQISSVASGPAGGIANGAAGAATDPLSTGFNKALDFAKKNPFSAASMAYTAYSLLNKKQPEQEKPTEYNGPLKNYQMSPNFQGRQANPADFQYTPKTYAEGGIASYDKGGEIAMDYWRSQQHQADNPPSGRSDPGARYAGDVVYDLDPDTKYLDPVTAAQVRMAKINKRANMQTPGMKRPTPMGQLNLAPPGIKAAAAPQSIDPETYAAQGGIMHSSLGGYAAGGNPRLLKGPGDGMSDNIPATISGKQPARLADGEFVVPADVVSHLGNGSTDAGAKVLHEMMDKVRQARTGNSKQGKQINAHKFVPT